MRAVVLLLSLALASCTGSLPPEQQAALDKAGHAENIYRLPLLDGIAYEFKLKDGTRCVSMGYRGGITCEWKNAER